ncbi:hypothetical protein [Frigoriflavimonas asaccharolytica]|uniref:Uncharacterized protein n=1 Tax=Frigoriflavimonas asaccharolytica TaxID=2735899 RepID=A0A8J8KAE1_9FLAO|nr:hypothetical protein [Frigoriflavimonas asaccharolytica]NRS94052.1 hypothetical protein [Frigoriflavimonas asaccharolytica]
MKLIFLNIITILIFSGCNAQYNEVIKIKEILTPLKIYENEQLIKNNEKKQVFSYIYNINSKKDSISYYDISNAPISETTPIIFTLKKNKRTDEQTLMISEDTIVDSLNIKFSDVSKSISINNTDTYFLNFQYYKELKQTIGKDNNALDLIDLLDDLLGDYPYQFIYLKRVSSNKKYQIKNYKISKAKIKTNRTQSEIADIWNVTYTYDKNNILLSILKKSTDNVVAFEKKLIQKKGSQYKFKIYNNVESRYEDNNEISFDIKKNTYISLQHHFQFGIVKEEISQLKRVLYKK